MIKASEFPTLDSIEISYIPDYQWNTANLPTVSDSDILRHEIMMEVSCCELGPTALGAAVAGPFQSTLKRAFPRIALPTSVDAAIRGKLFYGRTVESRGQQSVRSC
jgi:hypothetical protein